MYIHQTPKSHALTSLHLLIGQRLLTLPDHLEYVCDTDDEDLEVSPDLLTKRMKYLANVFQPPLEAVEIRIFK